jgi:hypothetical protein
MKAEHQSTTFLLPPRATERGTVEALDQPSVHVGDPTPTRFTPSIYSALELLLDASSCARDVGADLWQFSVELSALLRAGLTTNDCRWLIAKGLANHACEMTTHDGDRRLFQPCTNLSLPKRACFVITERGITCAKELLRSNGKPRASEQHVLKPPGASAIAVAGSVRSVTDNGEASITQPTWDSDRQQLRVGRIIVKEFKVPAANQEEGWVPRIDDPLTPKLNQDTKRRLHDTINSLNRNQKHPLLRFLGDGKGEGVRWEFSSRVRAERPREELVEHV